MKALWNIDLATLEEYYNFVMKLEKDVGRRLTDEETEIAFLRFMESKEIKPCGHTELSQEELIKELASKGNNVLSIDENGYKITKKEDKDNAI